MNTIKREQLLGQLKWRYATKRFDPTRAISPEDWSALEESLVLTPSSFGLQPWKFVVVSDPKVKERLVAASWGQRQIADAPRLVVFAIKKDLGQLEIDVYINRIAKVRGVTTESLKGFRDILMGSIVEGRDVTERNGWATRQVYIALGNLLNSAAMLGIDACPMEGIEPDKYDEILGLKQQGLAAVVVCALGYRAIEDQYAALKKVRFDKSEVLLAV